MTVRMNAEISETIKARMLGPGMQILGPHAQRKFVGSVPGPLKRPQSTIKLKLG